MRVHTPPSFASTSPMSDTKARPAAKALKPRRSKPETCVVRTESSIARSVAPCGANDPPPVPPPVPPPSRPAAAKGIGTLSSAVLATRPMSTTPSASRESSTSSVSTASKLWRRRTEPEPVRGGGVAFPQVALQPPPPPPPPAPSCRAFTISERSPHSVTRTTVTRSARPLVRASRLATSTKRATRSTQTTSAPARAAASAGTPEPSPITQTRGGLLSPPALARAQIASAARA